jgi:hypothetical protein
MLEFAKKYEKQLKLIYYDTIFDDTFKWEWLGFGREWIEPKDKTWEAHNFVSVSNGKVLGEMGYSVDVSAKKADRFYCAHFTKDNGYIFSKDLMFCFRNIFEKFGFNKLSYCVIKGNPVEKQWDSLTNKFRGRIVGIRHQDVCLSDGKLYDIKEYEIIAKDYFDATNNHI